MSKLIVSLTGGIASGKTYVSDQLSALGACVIDADILAREVVKKGSVGLSQVVETFGFDVLNQDGTLNRGHLKSLVFNHKKSLQKLNAILHPLIQAAFKCASELNQNKLEVWVIPLLTKQSNYMKFDRVLMVDVKQHIQVERVQQRDQVNAEMALKIIQSQPSKQARLELSTDVIANNAGFKELDESIDRVFGFYHKLTA